MRQRGVYGLLSEFGFEVYLADFTLREEYGAGGVVLDQCGVVRGHDHGTAAAGNLLEEPHDAFGRHGVEVAGGLVGQQHLRVAQQGACDDQPLLLAPGDTLEIGMLSSGLRGYLAVFGGFDIHPVLGSRSTDLKCHIGGLSGRALKAGDVLPVLRAFELPQERFRPLQMRVRAAALEDWALTTLTPHGFIGAQKFPLLRVVLGPQDDAFTEKGLFDFKSALYTVTQDSNRMAAKLSGAPIEAKAGVDILSDGIVEGSVQVSANGQPIVMLADHQSTGGYAKIATVIPCDIPALAQVRPGQLVGFRVVSVEEGAEACRKEKEKWTYLKEAIDHD